MSYDAILARSPFIVYQPGGTPSGQIVTSWTQVQKFIAARQGAITVFVDDSIVSPAHVPAVSGVTDFQGKGEIRPYRQNFESFSTLVVDDGATLKSISRLSGTIEVLADTKGAVPAFDFDYTANAAGACEPSLFVTDAASIGTTTTATTPAIVVPANSSLFMQFEDTGGAFVQQGVAPLVQLAAATSQFDAFFFGSEMFGVGLGALPETWVQGLGVTNFTYDEITAHQSPGGAPVASNTGTKILVNADFSPAPSTSQAAWFIDPANSTGVASDGNDGKTATTPVLSYNNGIVNRWGTTSPTLRQNTTLTWLSSQPAGDADPVIFTPIMVGTVATIQAPLGAAQQIFTGALGVVTPKNRATKQLLQADLGFAAPIGTLIQNTTAGKSSYAYVYKNIPAVSATTFALTQPLNPATVPIDFSNVPPTEIDTWATGDTFVAFTPVGVNLVKIEPTVAEYVPPNFPAQVQLSQIHALSANGPGNSNVYVGDDVSLTLCSFDPVFIDTSGLGDQATFFWNCFLNNDAESSTGSNLDSFFWGGFMSSNFGSIVAWQFDFDTIIDATGVVANIDFTRFWSAASAPNQGIFYVTGVVRLGGTQGFRLTSSSGLSGPWGPGSIDVVGMSRIFYDPAVGGATVVFGNIGSMALNDETSAVTFDATTGLWSTNIPITPANLDLAKTSGGFGGLAINPGGAAYTNFPGA